MRYRNEFRDELGITSFSYQNRAEGVVERFLRAFPPSPKAHGLDSRTPDALPFSIRLNADPPSVQVRRYPKGGMASGVQRISEKLVRQQIRESLRLRTDEAIEMQPFAGFSDPSALLEQLEAMASGAATPQANILVASEQDLTYECVILTLMDPTMQTILTEGLMDPRQVIKLLESLKEAHPDHFLLVKRHIMGIERDDNQNVPFAVVESEDDPTFEFLEQLPDQLAA